MAAGHEQGFWNNGQRVQELDTEEDSDTQGVGLITATGAPFSSDPLRFTGIDLGAGMARRRQNYAREFSEDEDSSDASDQDTELDEEGQALSARDNEEELVNSAMRRIQKAQASGRQDVNLSKKELSALENWRKRQAEASNERKKKKREQRFAVPLSQLGPISQKEKRIPRSSDALPPQPSNEMLNRAYWQKAQPPVGWFAYPGSSRPSTSESRRPPSRSSDREHSSSPFQYSYVQQSSPAPPPRHLSDPAGRTRSARTSVSQEEGWTPHYNPAASTHSVPASLDPFRFMTSGPSTAYHAGSVTSQRNASSSSMGSAYCDPSRPGGPSKRQSRRFTPDEEESASEDEDDDDTSDEVDAGARIGNSQAGPSTSNGREQIIVEVAREPTPEPRVTRSKKASNGASPKRKPVGGGNSRKKKGSR